jgi:hypothetical protein
MLINFIKRNFYLNCFATYTKAFGKRGVLCLFVCLSFCLFVVLSFCLFVVLSFCLFVVLSLCLSVCLLLEANVHQFHRAIFLSDVLCNLRKSFWKERCVLSVCLFVILSVCLFFCFWKRMSLNFIKRYFYLTCFATYAKAFGKRGVFWRGVFCLFVCLSFCLSVFLICFFMFLFG